MTGIKVELIGMDGLVKKLSLSPAKQKIITDGMYSGGLLVQGEARRLIKEKTRGSTYLSYTRNGQRRGKPVLQIAGARGQAPNTLDGGLQRLIAVTKKGLNVFVISKANYSKELEYGSHPFLNPALKNMRKAVLMKIKTALGKALGD